MRLRELPTAFLDDRRGPWLAVALVQALVAYNVAFHDATVGYDTNHHIDYVEVLAQSRLPTPEETGEFFVPPLPYALPAAALGRGWTDLAGAAKLGQVQNWLFSLGTLGGLVVLCGAVRPGRPAFATVAVLLTGLLPVYQKTHCYLRGEPLLAMFGVWSAVLGLRMFGNRASPPRPRDMVALGAVLGAAILSRQWAFFFFPALGLTALATARGDRAALRRNVVALAVTTAVAAGIGAWFYLSLKSRYGSFTAYNRPDRPGFVLSNQPSHFYAGLGDGELFSDPVRDSFANQLWPILYSETWGDYWCYFQVYGRHRETGEYILGLALEDRLERSAPPGWLETNRHELADDLGRVNAVSLLPTAVLLVGLAHGASVALGALRRRPDRLEASKLLGTLVISITAAGYFWFLVSFPDHGKGGTIKATYLLQVVPFTALLGAEVLLVLGRHRPAAARVVAVGLALVALHNLPFLLTRHTPW